MNAVVDLTELAKQSPWSPGKCRVPMWMGGCPAGFCDSPAHGPQLPKNVLREKYGWLRDDVPYCFGPCCTSHGGPAEGDPIIFQDGLTDEGRPMWCAVMPDFVNLQESVAGFSGNPMEALANLARVRLQEARS